MKPSFDLANQEATTYAPEWLNLDLPGKDGGVEKAIIFIVGNPQVDDVVICPVSLEDSTEIFERKNYIAVCVEAPPNVAIDGAGIIDLIRRHKQTEQAELAAEAELADFKQRMRDNMRIMTFNLPGTIERLGERKQGQLPAIAYIFGSVGPGRIDFQPTSSDFLNDPGQEIADSTNRGANDRQILAVDQAVKAGGDLAVVFVHEMRTLNDGYEEAALQAISKGKGKKLSLENDTAETLPQTSGWRAAIGRVTSVLTPR